MKRDRTLEKTLYRHLGLFGMPSASQLDASRARIRERLSADVETSLGQAAADVRPARAVRYMWRAGVSMAAACILLVVVVSTTRWPGAEALGSVAAADGSLYSLSGNTRQVLRQGDSIDASTVIHSNGGAGAMLALADGSRVEMRSQSELSLERADDGVSIRLRTGSIIVNAAKQPRGHLYVQTKDVTVSVVGTIFLVNAETDGSRVAVIEGEVRVHEGINDTKLRPGEQVSTSRTVAARPVKEEIAWSRHLDAHLAILAAFEKGMAATSGPLSPLANTSGSVQAPANQAGAATAGGDSAQASSPRPQFEEASIRPCDPDNLPPAPAGARGGGANSFQMTPGRTHALCLTLATIIRHAYGYGPADLEFLNPGGRARGFNMTSVYGLGVEDGKRVRGGPDWVRSDHYTIEAVADGAADAATMSGPMMRDLLERRFQLKVHVETEQVPAFTLSIARGGLKIKPVSADGVQADGFIRAGVNSEACDSLPAPPPGQPAILRRRTADEVRRGAKPNCGLFGSRNGPNQVFVAGGATLGAFGRALGSPLGGVQVLDKTGNADKFNFILEFVVDENTPGPRFLQGLPPPEPSDIPRGQTIFAAVEDQLGLRLEPSRAPREFILIDRVERPSPN
jgi:uncharacterized protein (TIGR03435 family)